VEVVFPSFISSERHGIFVGNCQSMVIENNYVRVNRLENNSQRLDGILIYGKLGQRMIVRQNHLDALDGKNIPGIFINVLNPTPSNPLWDVTDNVARLEYGPFMSPADQQKVHSERNLA
jgi:hypothetical protein